MERSRGRHGQGRDKEEALKRHGGILLEIDEFLRLVGTKGAGQIGTRTASTSQNGIVEEYLRIIFSVLGRDLLDSLHISMEMARVTGRPEK